MDLFHPDKTITAPDLESLALEYLGLLPIPGVEGSPLNPRKGELSNDVHRYAFDICGRKKTSG